MNLRFLMLVALLTVRFDNGDERVYSFDHDPAMLAGDLVRASGASIVRR
ncbi:MAG: hypothetical protein AAB150_09070 [Pseudomonadota bacterium]